MTLCPHCMQPTQAGTCTHCGKPTAYTAAAHHLPVSAILNANGLHSYSLGAALGQGGFGVTYIAYDMTAKTRVAIKEYLPVRIARRGARGRVVPETTQETRFADGTKKFLQEAKVLVGLEKLDSVVHVLDFFQENGTAYIVMEYLDGTPLHHIVQENGSFPPDVLFPKLPPLLRDIGRLHAQNLIHRDIAPDNIMLMPDGSLKLLDFGSALEMTGNPMEIVMKHGFAPLEQYQTHGQGPWTDVHAMAATIYYCITGQTPPTALDRLDGEPLTPPSALGVKITANQEAALMWGLELQPVDRAQNMDQFCARFERWIHEKVRIIPSISTPKPQPKPESPVPTSESQPAPTPASEPVPTPTPEPAPAPQPKKWRKLISIITGSVLAVALLIVGIVLLLPPKVHYDGAWGYTVRRDVATIVEYTGSATDVEVPAYVGDKRYTVYSISAEAFAGNKIMETISFRFTVNEIEEGAFDQCPNLKYVLYFSGITPLAPLRDFVRINMMMENYNIDHIRIGKSDELYGITENDEAVLLYVPNGLDTFAMQASADGVPVTAIDPDFMRDYDYLSGTTKFMDFYVPNDLAIPYEILNAPVVWRFPIGSFAESWYYTCLACEEINALRGSSVQQILPNEHAVRAAMVRAEELHESFEHTRPNGESWSTVPELVGLPRYWGLEDITKLYSETGKYDASSRSSFFDNVYETYTEIYEGQEKYCDTLGLGFCIKDGVLSAVALGFITK